MELSTKAALGICGMFIAGLCYVVDQTAPAINRPVGLEVIRQAGAADFAGLVDARLEPTGRASALGNLTHRSPFELQAEAQRREEEPLVLAAVPAVPPSTPVALPPLRAIEPGPEPAFASAAEAESVPGPLAALEPVAPQGGPPDAGMRHGPQVAGEVSTALAASGPGVQRYRVRKGDTLTTIARRQWQADGPEYVRRLIEANPQLRKRPDRILVGEELIIPGEPVVASHAAAGRRPELRPSDETPAVRRYTIRERDSLAGIARRYLKDARRWREIAELNNLKEPSKIIPGMEIRLPVLGVATQG